MLSFRVGNILKTTHISVIVRRKKDDTLKNKSKKKGNLKRQAMV